MREREKRWGTGRGGEGKEKEREKEEWREGQAMIGYQEKPQSIARESNNKVLDKKWICGRLESDPISA